MPTYRSKAKDSYNTRMRFLKFHCVVNDIAPTINSFLEFDLSKHEDLVTIYTCQYYQWDSSDKLEGVKSELSINEIYKKIKHLNFTKDIESEWFEKYFKIFKTQYSEDNFKKDTNAQECYYCKITLDEINTLASEQKLFKKNERGFTMEIDRKKPNLEYTNENCVPACYWCNNAKTDEFDDLEFMPIAEQIKAIFNKRLNS